MHDRLNLQDMTLIESYPKYNIFVPLDDDQFEIALLNLFINAIEAMKPGKGILKVALYVENDLLTLKIEDNGKGIPKNDIPKMFEPFFSAKKTGAGLGLTTVQNIIHSHHGKIAVESEINRGTTITITFQTYDVE